jgi:hypothetical protein
MSAHIRDDRWADFVDGGEDAEERRHVDGCASCRATLAELREGWELAGLADVPEPPPLYWDSFRRGVGQRIAQEAAPRPHWGSPALRWALAATVVLSLSASLFAVRSRLAPPPPTPVVSLPAWSPLLPGDEDPGLSVLEGLDAADLAHASCGDVSLCLADASDEEGDRIARGLEQELKGRSL